MTYFITWIKIIRSAGAAAKSGIGFPIHELGIAGKRMVDKMPG